MLRNTYILFFYDFLDEGSDRSKSFAYIEQCRAFKKESFISLKTYFNLYRAYVQCFELYQCRKVHWILPGIVSVQSGFHW
jgi:hypothetical protein